MAKIYPNLHPDVSRVRAVITTRWGKNGYRPLPIPQIESYYVDSALDTDADTWTIDIGDPRAERKRMFDRDSEVRVQLFGVGREATNYIMSGIADEISYDDTGLITLIGRDLSALAIDSACPPQNFALARAWAIVGAQAKELGFREVSLGRIGTVKKKQYTDGSETYWEFWYRLYRKEKMWIWTEPNGTLIASRLNYDSNPSYFFGDPKGNEAQAVQRSYIPVEHAEIRKSTQQRIGEVWVYGHRGDNGFLSIAKDPQLRSWIKRPRKIMLDTEAHTVKAAQRTGWQEIFEGKVGSMELRLTIPDPGFPIRMNRLAHVRIPQMDLEGNFFIVGTRLQGGPQGFLQEVRLREAQYALTRRIPADPKLAVSQAPAVRATSVSLGEGISGLFDMPESWGPWFLKAAKEFHGQWDFKLFLATLLGMCYVETQFKNIRQDGGPGGDKHEWEPPPAGAAVQGSHGEGGTAEYQRQQWRIRFANEAGDGIVTKDYGVGPMQLTDVGLKHRADDRFKAGFRNEFEGGRWHAEHNIWIAAAYLREILKDKRIAGDSGRDIDIWMGVMAYNRGIAGAVDYFNKNNKLSDYAQKVKVAVYTMPGFMQGVTDAITQAQESTAQAADGSGTDGNTTDGNYDPKVWPTPEQALANFKHATFPPSKSDRRMLILSAAIWAHDKRDSISYTQDSRRMKDFDPPPNVPEATDCSGFATWCYKVAGAADPNGANYNGSGYTGSLWDNGRKISVAQLKIGDLVFYYRDPHQRTAHVAVYIGFGKVMSHGGEAGPNILDVKYATVFGCMTYFADEADVPANSGGGGGSAGSGGGKRSVVIQAGHDPGTHSDQPYGHTGQSGASGEQAFTQAVRNACVSLLAADNRFTVDSGTAWTGSAGASAAPGDDVNSKSDVFIAVHAYRDTGLSGYFFGWPSARGEAVISSSKRLRDSIIGRWAFSGAPSRNASRDQQLETYYGYYAWGHPSRKFPDNVDHTAGTRARLLIECGHLGTDGITTHQTQIARVLYEGICDYFNLTPLP